MNYFGEQVINVLSEQGVYITPSEQLAYVVVCEEMKQCNKGLKTKKNPQEGRQYSLWHLPTTDKQSPPGHWLILPGRSNWQTKNVDVVPKMAVNIVTGEKRFLKIRRPQGEFYEAPHIKASLLEAYNNYRLGVPAYHCERNTVKGYKAYLFQPYEGDTNVLDMIEKSSTTPRQILGLLLASGNALYKIHKEGFMHNDFSLQNVVYNAQNKVVSIVDLEQMLSTAEGEKGLKEVHIRMDHLHPEWLFDAVQLFDKGKRVTFTPHNDTYAFLHSADMALQEASIRQESPAFIYQLQEARAQIVLWKAAPFKRLPELKDVLQFLHKLEVQTDQHVKKKINP